MNKTYLNNFQNLNRFKNRNKTINRAVIIGAPDYDTTKRY